MKGSIVGLFILLSLAVFGQPENAEKKVVNNKVCYIHVVQEGNTIYGIHRLYNVPVQKIIAFNKGSEPGLKVGEIIYVPTDLPVESTETVDHTFHIVEANQTLYGISKIYNCSVDDLLKLNPDAANGIKVGEKLKIKRIATEKPIVNVEQKPKELVDKIKVAFKDSIALHTVEKKQTLYSISKRYMVDIDVLVQQNNIKKGRIKEGQVLEIPLKKEVVQIIKNKPLPKPYYQDTIDTLTVVKFPIKEKYKIAVILPFLYDKNGSAISGLANVRTKLHPVSDFAVDFYAGAQIALDSLEKMGLIAEVEFYDSKRDSATVAKLVNSSSFQNTDIVIGPLFTKTIEVVANWAKSNQKRMVVPVPVDTKFLKENPYISCAVPSELTQIKALAYFIATKHGDNNVILVKSGLSSDDLNYQVFRDEFNRLTTENSYRGVLKEIKLGSSSGSDLASSVVRDTLTIFVDLSENVSHIMKFMTTLNKVKNKSGGYSKANIIAVGRKEWMNINELNSYYKNRFQLHYVSPNDLNYEKPEMKQFVLSIRDQFGIDASKYAAQGFDVTYSYLSNYCLGLNVEGGLINDIRISEKGIGNGSENSTCFILKQEDFLIKRVGVVYDKRANQ